MASYKGLNVVADNNDSTHQHAYCGRDQRWLRASTHPCQYMIIYANEEIRRLSQDIVSYAVLKRGPLNPDERVKFYEILALLGKTRCRKVYMYGGTSTLLGLQGPYHGSTKALLIVSRDGGERVQTGAYGPTHIGQTKIGHGWSCAAIAA